MDVKSAFLSGELSKIIYMEQPSSFVMDSNLVFRLKKSLYGLKQAPQAWYNKIDNFFLRLDFKCIECDHSLYVLHINGYTLIVYVYDLILRLKKQLVDSFDMTDLGTLHYFLGLQVLPLCDGFFISQSKYVMEYFYIF